MIAASLLASARRLRNPPRTAPRTAPARAAKLPARSARRRRHGRCGGRRGLEIPNAVITSIPGERRSVVVRERVVVGEPLPPKRRVAAVPSYSEYRYAVVNDRRVIVEPRTRKVIKIID